MVRCRHRTYVTFEAALSAAKRGMEYARKQGVDSRLKPYRCKFCGQWAASHADQAIRMQAR